ncbi:MAG TPA: 50S ribosomal protein L25 [Dehalococcoidia bacterium]|nr:50S ribosomal protein L25 [Dehalococcoidia bacterium]
MAQSTTRPEITVSPRAVLGKKVAKLRRQQIVPANIYGHRVESAAIQVPAEDLASLLRRTNRTDIIYLRVGPEEERPVFVKHIQRDFLTDEILHVDFQQVSLSEKVRMQVPIHVIGVAPAVDIYGGALVHNIEEITVEGLPTEIPSGVEVDISGLEELDSAVHVRDIHVPSNVTVITDLDMMVAKVASTAKERAEAEALGVAPVSEEAAEGEEAEAAPEAEEEAEE